MAQVDISVVLKDLFPHKKEFDKEVIQKMLHKDAISIDIFYNGHAVELRYSVTGTNAYNSIELGGPADLMNLYQIMIDDLNQTLRGEI